MNPARLPIACELFAQWRRVRGNRLAAATSPFWRGWETLLEDAGILSATDRSEAERDARALAQEGWLELKSPRYRPHLVDRVAIPLAAESRWQDAFGFTPPTDDEARQIREFRWEPELAFLGAARVSLPFSDLQRLNEFLIGGGRERPFVPIKERSLHLFGDEKRLDALVGSALFAEGRLKLAQLRCELAAEPLAWKRGPAAAAAGPVIVLENAATWHSYDRWNQANPQFSAVVYGAGNRFLDGVGFLAEIFRELGGSRPVLYFGDLDPQGLRIPQIASRRAQLAGLPRIEPHLWSYRQLLALGANQPQPNDDESDSAEWVGWLGELAEPARRLLAAGQRLAQERVGWELLRSTTQDAH
jgi:hypothetical protein